MSITFKVKDKKLDKKKNKISETLDSKHLEVLKEFEFINNRLPQLENNLRGLEESLKNIQKEISSHPIDIEQLSILDDELYKKKYEIEDQIYFINSEIKKIKDNSHLNDYFTKTAHLLYYYYDGAKTLQNEYKSREDTTSTSSSENVIYLEESEEETVEEDVEDAKESEDETIISDLKQVFSIEGTRKTKITDFIEKENGFEKAEVYDKYIKLIKNQTFVQKDLFMNKTKAGQGAICLTCNISLNLIYSEGLQICGKCGRTEYILIDSEKPSFREPPPEVSYFAYKRINHFNEWLSQFQAKESTKIDPEIYKLILLEMKKERITDLKKVTPTKIREYLKKLKLNKYYEHVPHILNKLNNKKVPEISKETEEKLRQRFKEIQAPFMKVCPPHRKNFLSYSYVLHKFVELLGLNHLKKCFPLLKSREKLHEQDKIWKDICRELNWEYIKSI